MSHAEQGGMRSINVKVLMGHSIGVEDSYYRPQERDISEDYKKAIPSLTISENREAIQAKLLDRDNAMQNILFSINCRMNLISSFNVAISASCFSLIFCIALSLS